MKTDRGFASILWTLVGLFAFLINDLTGTTINVPADFPTIQQAINAAVSGDTIQIAAGTYPETPVVNGKSLTIVGAGVGSTIIQCPAVPMTNSFLYTVTGVTYFPVLMCQNGTINVQNLTVDANNQGAQSPGFFVGIGYHNAGGTISGVEVINARFPAAPGNQTGNGILVANDTGTATINVLNSTVNTFQKTAISVRGLGLTINVTGNTLQYTPLTSTPAAAPNGITIQDQATGVASNNNIQFIRSTTANVDGTGILPFNAGPNLVILNNTVTNSDLGIAAVNTGNNLLIQGNQCNNNTTVDAIGIVVLNPVNLSTLIGNTMANNGSIDMLLSTNTILVRDAPDTPSVPLIGALNPPFVLANNIFIDSPIGLEVAGLGGSGPAVSMNSDQLSGQSVDFIVMDACPNDIWPTTHTVSFNGLITGVNMTFAQFQQTLTMIIDKHNNPALGLVLDFIPLPPSNFIGVIFADKFLTQENFFLRATWPPTEGAVSYRIFRKGKLVATIPASGPLVFKTLLRSKREAKQFALASVNGLGEQSNLTPITILKD